MKPAYSFVNSGQAPTESTSESGRPNNEMCIAHGCPLPGGISESTRGGGPWLCRFHFLAQPDGWQRITRWIRSELAEGKHPRELHIPKSEWERQA